MRVLALSPGTSVDAIDVALADLSDADGVVHVRLLAHAERPWSADLRARIIGVLPPAKISVGEVCALDTVIGQTFGDVGAWAMGQWGGVDLVVSHGQTVFHWVEGDTARGTLQIGAAAWIAERTRRPVVSDLRSSDVAFGGHGAPLTSLLDYLWLSDQPSAVVNIGGIVGPYGVGRVVVSGGGTRNSTLMRRLDELLPDVMILTRSACRPKRRRHISSLCSGTSLSEGSPAPRRACTVDRPPVPDPPSCSVPLPRPPPPCARLQPHQ